MSARIGINGFGRIGRDYLRYVLAADDAELNEWGYTARLVDLTRLVAGRS